MANTTELANKWHKLKYSIPTLEKEIEQISSDLSRLREKVRDNTASGIDRLLATKKELEAKQQQLVKDKESYENAKAELIEIMRYANIPSIKIPPSRPGVAGLEIYLGDDGELTAYSTM